MNLENTDIYGLTDEEVVLSRKRDGINAIDVKKESRIIKAVKGLIAEPMIILLLIAASIYFITGNIGDGIFMAFAIILVASISLYQDSRSRVALEKLQKFTQVKCKVIRNGHVEEILSSEMVMGDYFIVEEGNYVNADGTIIQSNDFAVNESLLTGESMPVYKDKSKKDNKVYKGTTVVSGLAIGTVTAIGNNTKLGQISKSIEGIKDEPSPLELQINNFVKQMVIWGSVFFVIVWALNYFKSQDVLDSLLKALTLAMSILPEEIPVAFTTFMALGAWRLMKMGIVVKEMKTVETLGIATIICTDKTGTITENRMSLSNIYTLNTGKISDLRDNPDPYETELLDTAMWASEPIPFDLMEKSIHNCYAKYTSDDLRSKFKMIHEYPLSGEPPMMTHIFENDEGERIIAAKGAPETIMAVSDLDDEQKSRINNIIHSFASEGYRVLGVASSSFKGNDFPSSQQNLKFEFKGILAFHDPPKKNIEDVFNSFYEAGIGVKIITGDNAITTESIAKAIGFKGFEKAISGEDLMALTEEQQKEKALHSNIFYRMFPEAKFKLINILKDMGHIVAMTGDGVNDGPALKAAHIGIAMGKKGTEIAKQSASLILVDDDLARMVDAVAMGRKIYSNLKKAIRYIISIHIPIILTVSLPLILGWKYPNIFSPVHVILLELIMGPTCSIIYENEPLEDDIMDQTPRPFSSTFFNRKELMVSIVQGLVITLGALVSYQYAVLQGFNEDLTRTMVYVTLISSNIVLTLVNRSFIFSILKTFKYKNPLVMIMIAITILFTLIMLYVPPVRVFFDFESLEAPQLMISAALGFLCTIWFEFVKAYKRRISITKS